MCYFNSRNIKFGLTVFLSLISLSFLSRVPWEKSETKKGEVTAEFRVVNVEVNLEDFQDTVRFKEIDHILSTAFSKGQFNGQFLYAEGGNVLYSKSFGYKDLRNKTTLTNDDRFQLASTSKPFTGVAIMLLQDKGLVDIEKTVKEYLPDFLYDSITVKNLLQHRSGLPNYIYTADIHWDASTIRSKRKSITNADITSLFKKHVKNLDFKPGSRFRYCNTNYAYLALIIEAVSKQTYSAFLEANIFTPLNMDKSFVYDHSNPLKDKIAQGFSYSRRLGIYEVKPDYLDAVVGDKGIYSNVEDVFKFDRALYDTTFLSSKSLALLFEPAMPLEGNRNNDYGLGFRVKKEDNGQETPYHNGWWKGFRTYFIHDKNNDRTLIWLNNRSNVTVNKCIDSIMSFDKISQESEDQV